MKYLCLKHYKEIPEYSCEIVEHHKGGFRAVFLHETIEAWCDHPACKKEGQKQIFMIPEPKLKEALETFQNAAAELAKLADADIEEFNNRLAKTYPFHSSFETINRIIHRWKYEGDQ